MTQVDISVFANITDSHFIITYGVVYTVHIIRKSNDDTCI